MPRFEGIETLMICRIMFSLFMSEEMPRFEGIETSPYQTVFHQVHGSEEMPRFEGIETNAVPQVPHGLGLGPKKCPDSRGLRRYL